MTLPSTDVISEFAREVVRSHAQDIERMSVGEMMSGDPRFDEVTEDEFEDVEGAIYDQARTLAETLTWPQEMVADVRAVASLLRVWATEGVGAGRYDPLTSVAERLESRFADRIAALDGKAAS